jgi:DNA-nicking Smr family endonuclease
MPKQRPQGRTESAPPSDDALAFRAAVRDVTPLAQTPLPDGLVKTKPRVRRRRPKPVSDLDVDMPLVGVLQDAGLGGDASGGDGSGDIKGSDPLTFQRAGVRTQVVRRLRRGLIPIEDELDLHGFTQTAARDQLARFLEANRDAGHRCVRIIHGKGYRSGARGPILKIAVNQWLRRHLDVMAVTSAKTIDGGTGAVYVLLRA